MVLGFINTDERKSHLGKIGFVIAFISIAILYLIYEGRITINDEQEFLWLTEGKWVVVLGLAFMVSIVLMYIGMKKWLRYRGYID